MPLGSFFSKDSFKYQQTRKIRVFSMFKNCRNSNFCKNIKKLDSSSTWKLKFFSLKRFLETWCTILYHDFIVLWTLGLNDEILGFFEFLLLNSNVQRSIKRWKNNLARDRCRGETLVFATMTDLVINKILRYFQIRVKKKILFHFLHDVEISWERKRIQ